ncbi:AcrR family transcriptional regulator [Actinomadura cellulosilytica]|uniref:AcrR family transcriptional regulator n=2 Tax=Thermomonospora cellulosilytica TaxID=1411118 RepID=A0A7W3MT44_9ACTN|nr:AcrR family transcriptional regulator [Thermomonospora cellulosilytica]
METMPGLRERKKEATRQAIHEAALRLAVEHGLDQVTVEAIADVAGVSRRTFSNYFAGKEDAVLYGDERRMSELMDEFAARPPEEPSWAALRAAFDAQYERLGRRPDPEWAARARLAKKHPSLAARQMAHYSTMEQRLTGLIAEREEIPAASPRPRVMAAAFLTCLRIATVIWTEDPSRPLNEIVHEVLAEYARPFR